MKYYADHKEMKSAPAPDDDVLTCDKCNARECPFSHDYLNTAIIYECGRVDVVDIETMGDEWVTLHECRKATPDAPRDAK